MTLCVLVAYAKENVDKATIGLTLANAGLEGGDQASVIFTSEGVRLAVKGYADGLDNGQPFQPVKTLLTEIARKGGRLHVCTPCMKKRGIAEADILAGIELIDGAGLIRLVKAADRNIQL